MCTTFKFRDCVGRNFDYEISYEETIIKIEEYEYGNKYAIVGIGTNLVDYPLLYDGMNSEGLVVCGLAFENSAKYNGHQWGKINIPAYDFTFKILSECKSVWNARYFLKNVSISSTPFSDDFPASDLHWLIADKDDAIIVEATDEGLDWYTAKTNVLTNNPKYPNQMRIYEDEKYLIGSNVESLKKQTRGTETWNLKGDYTSFGRFERTSYLLDKMEKVDNIDVENHIQAFHLLSNVEQIYGITSVDDKFEYTIYGVVYDTTKSKIFVRKYGDLTPQIYDFDCYEGRSVL